MSFVCLAKLPKDTVTRTMLYRDQEVSSLEVELWHTAVFQRLYYIRQLGFSDKVFPDAIHNRFNHVLGVCQRAEDILVAAARQTQPANVPELAAKIGAVADPKRLYAHIDARVDVARLMALLHDLSHIPFGHTLEDELHLFETKHDARKRQIRMFNRITAQLIWGLYDDIFGLWPEPQPLTEYPIEQLTRLAKDLLDASRGAECPAQLMNLDKFLVNLYAAQVGLIVMHDGVDDPAKNLLLPQLFAQVDITPEVFNPISDYFLIDAIGNTICADLLDYTRRDMRMANIVGDYDDRLFRWFVLSEVRSERGSVAHLAIKVFSNKLKPDILREILKVLELRYDLAERVLFHPAKCCAGAMLGRAVEALGLADSVPEMLAMGDEAFLVWINDQLTGARKIMVALDKGGVTMADLEGVHRDVRRALGKRLAISSPDDATAWKVSPPDVRRSIGTEIEAGVALMDRLRSRHYYQLVFEVTTEADDAEGTGISSKYKNSANRSELMRDVEVACGLPPGTVLIHCPRRRTIFKEANVLVLFSQTQPPSPLHEADKVSPQLKRIAQRARDMAEDYKSIWRLRVFLHKAYRHQAASVTDYVHQILRVHNSQYLESSLKLQSPYKMGADFLRRFGGEEGRRMVTDAVEEMRAARKGTEGKRLSFDECLDRQAELHSSKREKQ